MIEKADIYIKVKQNKLQLQNGLAYLDKLILRAEVSVAADPVAMGFDEVRLLLDVALLHVLQVLHLLHQLLMGRSVGRTASTAASVMTSEDHVTAVLVRMVVTYQ